MGDPARYDNFRNTLHGARETPGTVCKLVQKCSTNTRVAQPQRAPTAQPPATKGGQVIQGPWKTPPPPKPEPPSLPWRIIRRSPLLLILSVGGATPLSQRYLGGFGSDVRDDTERAVIDHARTLLDPNNHDHNMAVQAWARAEIDNRRESQKHPQSYAELSEEEEKRRREKCEVASYSKMSKKCGKYGMQAHHIVPDYTLRYGTREEAKKNVNRIPNTPTLYEGMSICVTGHARSDGTEHNSAHRVDAIIAQMGTNSSPPHTATVKEIKTASIVAMIQVRPDCAKEILAKVKEQFAQMHPDQLLKTKQDPRGLEKETLDALKAGVLKK